MSESISVPGLFVFVLWIAGRPVLSEQAELLCPGALDAEEHDPDLLVAEAGPKEPLQKLVITSYSIHYTKLYESRPAG